MADRIPEYARAKVEGLRQARDAFQAFPEIVRARMLEATEVTLREIQRQARARLERSPSIRTRSLFNHVLFNKPSKVTGIGVVGVSAGSTTYTQQANFAAGVIGGARRKFKGVIVTSASGRARLVVPTKYAHIVERGSVHMPAEPFMQPARDAEEPHHIQRMAATGRDIERDMAAIGSRNL